LAISLSVWSKAQPNPKATEKGKWGLYRSGRPKRRFPRTEIELTCRHCEKRSDEAIHPFCMLQPWIASLRSQ
jgi:hypothetical protein